jgi:hypothetical protein
VALNPDETVSIDELLRIISAIDKSRELGLVNMVPDRGLGQMGLFLGPSQSSLVGAGASVGTPGRSTTGFGNFNSSFFAHTHPRELEGQLPHDGELQTDIESAKGMEMVRPTDGKTFFCNDNGAKNNSDCGHFANVLKLPKFNYMINGIINLSPGSGQQFTGAPPPQTDVEEDRLLATQQVEAMWEEVQNIAARPPVWPESEQGRVCELTL